MAIYVFSTNVIIEANIEARKRNHREAKENGLCSDHYAVPVPIKQDGEIITDKLVKDKL